MKKNLPSSSTIFSEGILTSSKKLLQTTPLLFVLLCSFSTFAQTNSSLWKWVNGNNTFNSNGVYGTKGVAASTNKPGARERSVTWRDASGNLWLFGGIAYPASGSFLIMNDLWKYDPTADQWTWVSGDNTTTSLGVYGTKGVPAPTNTPGARYSCVSWTDASGNLWLFGGEGSSATVFGVFLNDLWKFDPTANQWTWVSGDNTTNINPPSVYGAQGVAAPTNIPGGREGSVSWIDASGNLWLLGGYYFDAALLASRYLNDLWKYSPTTDQWTWVSGNNTFNNTGVYGIKGVAASPNKPGGRQGAVSWTDASGNLWLFGGNGYNATTGSFLNDLWKYNLAANQWTWVSGDNGPGDTYGVYGTQGVAASTNKPGSRRLSVSWSDASGNLWLFGGSGFAATTGLLNDLWKYDPTANQWTWVKGDNTAYSPGSYGTRGMAACTNKPGGREGAVSWTDGSGDVWLFGGVGSTIPDRFNDLWKLGAGAPIAITNPVNSITTTGVTLNGTVGDHGLTTTTTFDYGTSPTLAGATNVAATNIGIGACHTVAVTLTGLVANTTYYFRVNASNSVGTANGNILNFITTPGAALNFDGTNDWIDIPHSASLISYGTTAELSIEYWINPGSPTNQYRDVIAKGGSSFAFAEFIVEGDPNSMVYHHLIGTPLEYVGVDVTYTPNTWQHIAITAKTGGDLKVYKNGVLQGTASLAGGLRYFLPGPTAVRLMADTRIGGRFQNGTLDEVRLWNRELCASEITSYINCEIPANSPGLVANYHFNQGGGGNNNTLETTLIDASGNGNTGALHNFALTGLTSTWVASGSVISGVSCGPVIAPEINVQGNDIDIVDEDFDPSLSDHRDFGNVNIGGNLLRTFTIQNTGTANLTVSGITMSGSNAGLFTIGALTPASPITPGNSATFTITFTPTTLGLKGATVHIASNDCDESDYDFAVQGAGTAPNPNLTINDVTQNELNTGTSTFTFTVSLSAAAGPGGVTFDIATQNNTATTGNNDYVQKSLTSQTIPAGSSTYTFAVTVNGDNTIEADETFFVNVTNVTGATISDGQGLGTITNDEACITNPVVVNSNNAGPGSLRQAVLDACPGSTITFDMTQVTSPVIISTFILVNKDLTIQGPGADVLTILNNGANNSSASYDFNVATGTTVKISDLTMSGGNTTSTNFFNGGAITNSGNLTVDQCTISNNNAWWCGGILSTGGTVYITNSTITGNNGTGYNSGGLEVNGGTVNVVNSTISGNTGKSGGGIQVQNGVLNITNSTISNNTAPSGGGILWIAGTINIKNSIIAGNTVITSGPDYFGTVVSQGYNLVGKTEGSTGFTQPSDQTGTIASPLNPLLGTLANNGGPTMTHALLTGSPAIDKGSTVAGMTTDQRGSARPNDIPAIANAAGGDGSDIGAFEIQCSTPAFSLCPSNQTANALSNSCSSIVTYTATATGVPVPTITYTFTGATTVTGNGTGSGSSFNVGVTTVSLTATNGCGNAASCTFTVTVVDTQNPSITCPDNISVNNTANQCGATVFYSATASDNCPGTILSYSPAPGSFFPVGTTTVMATATDLAGRTASCTFTVTVVDAQNPSITCPGNITVNNDNNQCGAAVSYSATGSDNCSGTIVSYNPASGSFFPVGPATTVTATATDASGHTANCTFTVTVVDAQNPGITCPAAITVTENPAGSGSATVSFSATGSDNCAGVSVGYSHAPGSSFLVGTTTVTATATDAVGHTASCTFTVTVNAANGCSINGPAIVCPNSTNSHPSNVSPAGGTVTHSWSITGNGTISGSTSGPSVSVIAGASGSYILTDNFMRNASPGSCTKTVTIGDATPPTITCPGNITVNNAPGQCGAVVTYSATASDNCSGTTIIYNPASGSFFPVGTNTVMATATDATGNTASCTFTVTVVDAQNPTINCLANFTVPENPAGSGSATVNYSAAASDNCPGTTVSYSPASGSSFPVGTTTVTAKATDAAGHTASCTFTVTVTAAAANGCSITGPSEVCAGSTNNYSSTVNPAGGTVTHSWSVSGSGTIYGSATGSSVNIKAGSSGTYTITDNFVRNGTPGSCTKTVTINAIPVVTISGPAQVCPSSTNTYTSTVTPAGGTVTHSWSVYSGSATISGSTTGASVTVIAGTGSSYTLKDIVTRNGCSSYCLKVVSIFVPDCNITGASSVNPNSTNTYNSTGSEPGATFSWAITGSGTISGSTTGSTVSVLAGASGSYTLALTVTKNGCSKTCSKTVTIASCTLTCPGNITVNNKPGYCGAYVSYPPATKSSNCSSGSITYSKASGSWFAVGTTTVTATLSSGASCSFTIRVVDNQDPVIVCPSDIVVNAPTNGCTKTVNYTVTATDNCAVQTLVSVPASGSVFNAGTTTVVVTATDAAGNSSTSSFTVTVKEYKDPVITCPANKTVNAAAGVCKAMVNTGTATATDNCPGVISITGKRSDNKALNDYYPVGVTFITWKAKDGSGNEASCQQKITVNDNQLPVVTNVSANPSVLWPADHSMKTVTVNYTSTDNCSYDCELSVTSNEQVSGTGNGDLSPDWQIIDDHKVKLRAERKANGSGRIYTITITCTDVAGNKTTKTAIVTVPLNNVSTRTTQAITDVRKGPQGLSSELAAKLTVQLMPNPTENYFNLQVNSPNKETLEIRMYNIQGKLVQQERGSLEKTYRFGDKLVGGMYIIEVRQGTQTATIRVVKL